MTLPPEDVRQTARSRIDHVVVLMLENRSFDHLLGYLDHPAPDYPGLRGASYPNPVNLDDEEADTADVSPDADHVLPYDPPHGHESIKKAMNGHGWRDFRMNGFAAAYGDKLAGREHIPVIYWARIQGLGFVGAATLAAAVQNFCHLSVVGGFPRALVFTAIVLVVCVVAGVCLRRLASLAGKGSVFPVAMVVVAVVLSAAIQAAYHGFYGQWVGIVLTFVTLGGLSFVFIRQTQEKKKQLARVPLNKVAVTSKRIMRCMAPAKIPVLGELARQFVVCTNWHSSVPGATWPNRQFAHAATSAGSVDIEVGLYDDTTIFDQLGRDGWRVYHDGMAQVMCYQQLWDGANAANWYPMDRFYRDVAAGGGGLPPYTFIEPLHEGPLSNSQHPGNNQETTSGSTDFQRGEYLVWRIYEALQANPELFRRTLLLITYDEHGGLFDHVPPPRAAAPGTGTRKDRVAYLTRRLVAFFVENRNSPFDFRCFGARVPAIAISPWVETGRWDPTLYDHTSIVASVRAWFAPQKGALSRRDEAANTFLHLVTSRAAPREDMPVLPEPAEGGPVIDEAALLAPPVLTEPVVTQPATVADDLREQLVTMAVRINENLPPAPSPGAVAGPPQYEATNRFEAHAQRARA